MITAAEELHLIRKAQAGDQKSVYQLIDAHRPLIRKIVRKLGQNMDEEDAISEGITGLLRALPKYDLESGYRFNTYARHYIGEAIRDASLKSPLIRFKRSKAAAGDMREARKLYNENGYISPAKLAQNGNMTIERANQTILKLAHTRPTAYAPITEAFDIPDTKINIEDNLDIKRKLEIVDLAKEALNPRERHIFEARTAANDEPLTLEELGQIYGVSRERIRQIEVKALDKIMKRLQAMGVKRIAA